jgi:hypothetical protein
MAEAIVCTICQNNLYDGRDILTTGCKHTFHVECIAKNAKTNNNKCPNCRQPIPSFSDMFTGYQSTTEKKKEKIISNEVYDYIINTFHHILVCFLDDIG